MRQHDSGVVLINVLVILALMASVVFAMVSLSEISITRSQRFSEAGQAQALIAAGEASAVVILRRDMAQAPQSDNTAEVWAVGQDEIAIAGGRFSLTISDAQALFNLNSLPGSGALGAQMLQRIIVTLNLPPDVGPRIAARLAQAEPLARLADLEAEAGVSADEVATLGALVTVLPGKTTINVNTAPDALLGVLADNPVQAGQLIGIRGRNGLLTPQDMASAKVILPVAAGYTSSYFRVRITVTIGDTVQSMDSLIERSQGRGVVPQVQVVARQVTLAGM